MLFTSLRLSPLASRSAFQDFDCMHFDGIVGLQLFHARQQVRPVDERHAHVGDDDVDLGAFDLLHASRTAQREHQVGALGPAQRLRLWTNGQARLA
jgi:hypothetical protein